MRKSDHAICIFYKKCQRISCRGREDVAQDFPAWAVVRLLEGATGSTEELLVDYLREQFGRRTTVASRKGCFFFDNEIADQFMSDQLNPEDNMILSELIESKEIDILIDSLYRLLSKEEVQMKHRISKYTLKRRVKAQKQQLKKILEA